MDERNVTDLSQFNIHSSSRRTNKLTIEDDFLQQFDLREFLLKDVLGENFEMEHNGEEVSINSYEELLKTIVKYLKARKYIGVGVGGVYIREDISENKEYVLLYKRYHEPENQVWSILGGSSKIHEKIEDTLVGKISRITGVSKDVIKVKDIIKANNHEESDFHFLSPAFYVDITNTNPYLYWGSRGNGKRYAKKRKVEIISSLNDFKKIGTSTYANPLLAWVPVEMINGHQTDEEGDNIFSFTTIQAIERHNHIRKATLQIVNATESIKSYKDWRIGIDI